MVNKKWKNKFSNWKNKFKLLNRKFVNMESNTVFLTKQK